MVKNEKKGSAAKWIFIVIFLLILGFISMMIAGIAALFVEVDPTAAVGDANVAIIKVHGPIMAEKASGWNSAKVTSSTNIIDLIDKADKNDAIKAVLFEINSPGGSAVASEEVANRISELNKTNVAWIREVGASGAYWISAATDHIVASRMSITGSIGVIGSYVELYGFLNRYNFSYNRLVAGKHKDMGSPFKEMPDDERDLIQSVLDQMHAEFIFSVAENRGMVYSDVEELATGQFYSGKQAFDAGLIDELGSKKQALEYIEQTLNITAKTVTFEEPKSFFEMLADVFTEQSFFVGKGIGESLTEQKVVNELKVFA